MWIKGSGKEATFPEKSWPWAAQVETESNSAQTERESPCRFYLPPLPSVFSSQDLKMGPHAQHCALFPGEHFSFPHYRHEKRRPSCLGKRPEGLWARCVWASAQVARKGLVVTAGYVLAWWLVVGGHQASASQSPADTNPGIQEQLDPSPHLPPSPPPPSTLVLRNAGWTFLQEMKRSSVQKAREGFVSPFFFLSPPVPFPLREGGRGGRSRTSSRRAFEVWEVKITGTASRLNRRFHLPGQIKAPAAGACPPCSPLTSKATHLPP